MTKQQRIDIAINCVIIRLNRDNDTTITRDDIIIDDAVESDATIFVVVIRSHIVDDDATMTTIATFEHDEDDDDMISCLYMCDHEYDTYDELYR